MMQRKVDYFLHSPCETSLRLFHVPDGYRTAIVGTISLKTHTLTDYFSALTGIDLRVSEVFLSGTFYLYLMSSQKYLLSL